MAEIINIPPIGAVTIGEKIYNTNGVLGCVFFESPSGKLGQDIDITYDSSIDKFSVVNTITCSSLNTYNVRSKNINLWVFTPEDGKYFVDATANNWVSVDHDIRQMYDGITSNYTTSFDWGSDGYAPVSVPRQMQTTFMETTVDYELRELYNSSYGTAVIYTDATLVGFRNVDVTTGSGVGTLTNAPTAGNPVGYLLLNIAGSTQYFPYW